MDGIRDGTPIALGYFVVSFTLGIAARNAGLTPFEGFLALHQSRGHEKSLYWSYLLYQKKL